MKSMENLYLKSNIRLKKSLKKRYLTPQQVADQVKLAQNQSKLLKKMTTKYD